MAASYCLPPDQAEKFTAALKDGTITPDKVREMTSDERRVLFAGIVGEENARDVNALLEQKLLLKDQKAGMVTWAKQVTGMTPPAQRDLLARIQKMDRLLNPAEERAFLADAAAQKLGATVTPDEARQISQLAKAAQDAQTAGKAAAWDAASIRSYGLARLDLKDYVESLKPGGRTLMQNLIDIANLPKSALVSILHLSAPGVQGWGSISTKEGAQGVSEMLKYFHDEQNYRNLMADMVGHPNYELARKAQLGLTDLSLNLSAREEAIMSTLVERANAALTEATGGKIPNLVRASNRAFTGYLNYVRFNTFNRLIDAAKNAGEDVSMGSKTMRDIASAINDFTGRGSLGTNEAYKNAAGLLNAIFFSPRKIIATAQMFNPERYLNPTLSAAARAYRVRNITGSLLATAAVTGFAQALGAKVDWDPRSQDFMKIQIGKTKFDITGGSAIWLRTLAQLVSGEKITQAGKMVNLGYGSAPTRGDVLGRYLRGKLSPIAGAMADWLIGTDMAGNKTSVGEELKDKMLPITINEFVDFFRNDPGNYAAIAPSLAAIFGVQMQTQAPHDLGLGSGAAATEMERLNFSNYDLPRSTGDPKFDELVMSKLQPLVDRTMNSFVQSAGYKAMSDAQRALSLEHVLKGLNRAALGQAIAADPQAYAKIRQGKVDPRLQAVMQAAQPQGAAP